MRGIFEGGAKDTKVSDNDNFELRALRITIVKNLRGLRK